MSNNESKLIETDLKKYKTPEINELGNMQKITLGSLSHCADGSPADKTLEPGNQGCN